MSQEQFSKRLLMWFDQHGRTNLPWQQDKSPYRVWIAEIMLQQTQVSAVIPYYQKFMARFANIEALATAKQDEVLQHWSGLGYYARARNLHKAAQIIQQDYAGQFPDDIEQMNQLPGIGRSTAAAILVCSMAQRHPILDGNVKRVLCRYHAIEGYPGVKSVEKELWALAEQHTPQSRVADYTQAIMDLGATLCIRGKPRCENCPLQANCKALQLNKVSILPTPKPKQKTRRLERLVMVCLLNSDKLCALLQRPQKGIWGGLWCPLEFDSEQQLQQWCADKAVEFGKLVKLGEVIDHRFSHFDLQITPLYLELNDSTILSDKNIKWVNLSKAGESSIGLPAPVSKLIHRLRQII